MTWRNDPNTLKMSLHSEPKVWETYFPQFKEMCSRFPPPFFVNLCHRKIAFVKFDKVTNWGPFARTIGLNMDPKERGKGYGKDVLKAALQYTKKHFPRMTVLAEIKPDNKASIKIFSSLGFRKMGTNTHIVDEKEVTVLLFYFEKKSSF